MEKVAVLLSSYNGEKYIREQIMSILAQKQVEVYLFIRDDCSEDSTVQIIDDLCRSNCNVLFTNRNERINVGVKNSFLTLLKYVLNSRSDIRYFCFADQDDVWTDKKIFEALNCFSAADRNILYFSNKTIVDSSLQVISTENIGYCNDISEICWGAQASGCTMLFDIDLAKIVVSDYGSIDLLHDSLFYRVAHIVGAKIVFDKRSFILYRQHQANVVGISGSAKTNYNWKGLLTKSPCFISKLCNQLAVSYKDYITPESKKYLDLIANYPFSIKARIRLISHELKTDRSIKLHLIWIWKIILRRL